MDENYLDNLLNEFSLDKEIDHKIEDELDNQMQQEKRMYQKEQELTAKDEFDLGLDEDASFLTEEGEFDFSEDQIDELDKLDRLADLDIGDLDFSDIDFDDLDITKLDGLESDDLDSLLSDFEGDLKIDDFFEKDEEETTREAAPEPFDAEELLGDRVQESQDVASAMPESQANLDEDSFDADSFLDSLLDDSSNDSEDTISEIPQAESSQSTDSSDFFAGDEGDSLEDLLRAYEEGIDSPSVSEESDREETEDGSVSEGNSDKGSVDGLQPLDDDDDLSDLLAMLDSVEEVNLSSQADVSGVAEEAVASATDKPSKDNAAKPDKQKKTFMQILFGEPDEDDIETEEEIAAREAKKAAKLAKKQKRAEDAKLAKEEKTVKANIKKKEASEKKKAKTALKAKKRAEMAVDEEPEKKLNRPAVMLILTLIFGGLILAYFANDSITYSTVIKNATNYFANQKYRKAYDEIVGVEVKEEDEELKDRIYTVMYVERLYESYNNNIAMERYEKALDSLLRGVDKYYEHYEEAKALGIVSDIDYSFHQIKTTLEQKYGITVEMALEINALDDYEYVQQIEQYVAGEKDEEIVE